ncbi:hypothetical protein HanXRQr2_Chr12g0535851 [Helianthus annuus]|uniref:Uncharacterized protein n=1 Tax=Helianthus annuus TaxID=4232 RepID=A0A9K3HFP2_HELAN|nr:hypothetical protein HanXRQr2_Chr12g0535851 [Helianthus annuus]KAJ0862268.1 hypothetical protein HanPSC8_Chr12g0516141 [Helianthus annuus]
MALLLLSSLSQTLQNAGVDLTHATISVQVDIGKRAKIEDRHLAHRLQRMMSILILAIKQWASFKILAKGQLTSSFKNTQDMTLLLDPVFSLFTYVGWGGAVI